MHMMVVEDPLVTSIPHESSDETTDSEETLFSDQPSIFILNTHLSQGELDDAENRLVRYGGKITYSPSEATLFLGKISKKKRAMLELRRCGILTEEIIPGSKSDSYISNKIQSPPRKRLKYGSGHDGMASAAEPIDLTIESEDEEDGARIDDPNKNKLLLQEKPVGDVIVLNINWMDRSIAACKPLPLNSFVVYQGRKIPESTKPVLSNLQSGKTSSQILERAKKDAASQSLLSASSSSGRFQHRRTHDLQDSKLGKLHPPTLHRQTTSENDEPTSLPDQPDWVKNRVPYACLRSAPLHSPNEDFISQLVKIRQIRKLTLNEIGVRAYSTSIAAIAAYPYKISQSSEVLQLPGCDAKIANLFSEFQKHGGCSHTDEDGNVSAADELDTDPALRKLNLFNDIWGVGAKTARDFYYSRGWRDLDDIVEHGWGNLSRVQQIGVKFFDEFQEGVSRSECEAIADIVKHHANKVRQGANNEIDCIIVGGYRRGKEISGDVDIILTHRDDGITSNLVYDLAASLEEENYITHMLSLHLTSTYREQQTLPLNDETGKHFDMLDKALVVWQEPNFDQDKYEKNPNPHRRVDIIISPWQTVGCAVLGWTGDTTFQRDLRRYVKKSRGWKFDSSGVRDQTSGHVVDIEHGGESWEERETLAMERLGIGCRSPGERCSR